MKMKMKMVMKSCRETAEAAAHILVMKIKIAVMKIKIAVLKAKIKRLEASGYGEKTPER